MSTHAPPRRLWVAGTAIRERQISRVITRTACFNIATMAAAALGGVIMARAVGPTVRGEYAAVTSWFGLLLLVGEVGQSAAVCFYVARDPLRARGYVATSRAMMLTTGTVALTAGLAWAPALAHGHPGLAGTYRVAFTGSLVAFVNASYTFSLQATDTKRWNLVRVTQPGLALLGFILLWQLQLLSLRTAIYTVVATMTVQLGYSYYWCRRGKLAPGRVRAELIRPLAKYGVSQLAAVTPAAINGYLDQLVLSQLVAPADLGRYAIAVSVTMIPIPAVSAIGNVAFPRLAAKRALAADNHRLLRAAVLTSAGIASAILLPAAVSAYWLVPLVFGSAYRGAVPLLWILAPGGVFLACGQVTGDLLRGLERPGLVAIAQGLAAAFTVVLLIALLPTAGVAAAAIASTVAYGIALAVMLSWLRFPPTSASKARHRRERNVCTERPSCEDCERTS